MVTGRAIGVYRALLRLYPSSHRNEYGEAMVQLFGDRWRDEEPNRSPLRWIAFWGGMVGDVTRTVFTERMEGSMNKTKLNRQNWWLWLAGLIGAVETVMGVGFAFDPEGGSGDNLVGVFAGLAVIMVFGGLWLRQERLRLGNSMVMVGVVPALIAGVVFFWFPPMWLSTIAAGAVMVKAAQEVVAAGRLHPRESAPAT